MSATKIELSNKEKFALLQPWALAIINEAKKDLRKEHLSRDRAFQAKYFPGLAPNRINAEDMARAYAQAVASEEKGDEIAEFIFNRWLLKNSDLYYYFEGQLKAINPNFSEISTIDDARGQQIIEGAKALFDSEKVYLFAIINSVVFSDQLLARLREEALQRRQEARAESATDKGPAAQIAQLQEELKRQGERYEKKLLGLQRLYERDVTALKKQVAALQRRLQKD